MNTSQIKLEALHEAYLDACDRHDYRVCDLLRQEMQRVVSGKPMLIPCESELKLDPNDILLSTI